MPDQTSKPTPPPPPSPTSTSAPAHASPAWSEGDLAKNPHVNAEKAVRVQQMFAAIARSYDLNNRLHSFGRDQAWRKEAVRAAKVKPTDTVLDAACGTGDLSQAFAKAGAQRVIGLDYTPEMLDLARVKQQRGASQKKEWADRIEYIQGDAMDLPVEDASVDIVSIAFGIRNVTDPKRAAAEFRRVLRPGGRLVILEFAQPTVAPVRWVNTLYTAHIMPRTATLISGDTSGAYRYLPRSVETFLEPAQMRRMLSDAGFASVEARPMTFGVCVRYLATV